MRVVAAPHDAVDAELAHRVRVAGRGERRADVDVAAEVVAGLVREDDRRIDAELADATVALHVGVELVHAVEDLGHPARSLLGEHQCEAGEAFEHSRHREVPQRPVGPESGLHHEHDDGARHLRQLGNAGAARVMRHRNAALLTDLPDRVVLRGEQRLDPRRVGGHAGEENAAQAVLVTPDDVLHRLVDVVEEDLGLAGPSRRCFRAEVGEPAVVGADAREASREFLGRRRGRDHRTGREERRDRVREDDLRDDTFGLLVGDASLAVPVPGAPVALEITERVRVLAAPRVELVAPLGREVLAVLRVRCTGVTIGRDDDVVIGSAHGLSPGRGEPRHRTASGRRVLEE